ncbi:extracellular solute-binding protein [Lutimaribacter marinistellae]|uniref:Extracellular solute-binding protein n=1 Tax=Lutimaribacter marinistellae TaxID=1820329 RepID=A0ABV7THS3_9RHOB
MRKSAQSIARAFTRRDALKTLGAASAAMASPAIVSKAFAASGEVNVYSWDAYISEDMMQTFEAASGIKVNLSTFGTNNEVLNKLRASKGEGFDIVLPSISSLQSWYDAGAEDGNELLQPIDETRLTAGQINPSIYEKSLDLGASQRGARYGVPFNWGTEGLAFNSEELDLTWETASWNDQWKGEYAGKMAIRPRSGLTSIALMIDGTGKMLDDAYQDEAVAHEVFSKALEFGMDHKPNIKVFWKTAADLTGAFTADGCVVGQSWDGTAINMWKETDGKIRYVSPKEGALTWMDGLCIPSGAVNVDQAYELINFLTSAQGGGMHAVHSGYNSSAIGAEAALDAAAQERFKMIYGPNGEAIANLWWWKPEAGWFSKLRSEYITRWETA